MTNVERDALIKKCKEILSEAYDEAAMLIVLYLEKHPSESTTGLCKEIDPDNWNALRHRADKIRKSRSEAVSDSPATPEWQQRDLRSAKALLRNPETAKAVLESFSPADLSTLRNTITDAQLTHIESDYNAASAKEPTVKSAQSKLGHAAAPKERYAAGALALFQTIAREATMLSILIDSEGIRPSDMEFTSQSTGEIVEDTHRVEKVSKKVREVVLILHAEAEMGS